MQGMKNVVLSIFFEGGKNGGERDLRKLLFNSHICGRIYVAFERL
jgi:hypothetical protein